MGVFECGVDAVAYRGYFAIGDIERCEAAGNPSSTRSATSSTGWAMTGS